MCLRKDEEKLLTFIDFPAANFQHIRTANPIESSFSTIWLRTKKIGKLYPLFGKWKMLLLNGFLKIRLISLTLQDLTISNK